MKKILIINVSFSIGGIQTSLQNLLENIKDDYEIDLLVLYPEGPLKERVPQNVRVLEASWMLSTFGMSQEECLKYGSVKQKVFRTIAGVWTKIINNRLPLQIAIRSQNKLGPYDVAIAYRHEGFKNEVCSGYIDMMSAFVDAKRRIAWVHNDCGNNPLDESYNDRAYKNVDKIVCVSKAVGDAFVKYHPWTKAKVDYCYNFLNEKDILAKSRNEQEVKFEIDKFICFSACRLSPEKGIVRAIEAFAPTFYSNKDVMWIIAGDGDDKEKIQACIKSRHLEKQVILIGQIDNPYPYIKNADVILSTSYFEAAPMLYSEARLLHTPVFTTQTSSSKEMLENGRFGIICGNDEAALRDSFKEMIEDRSCIKRIKQNLEEYSFSMQDNKVRFNKIIMG